jgi:peptide chain release factor 1
VIHHPSGARGEAREERSQLQNKKRAFRRMAESEEFKAWVRVQTGRDSLLEAEVDRMMWPVHLRTEVQQDGHWVEE